MRYRGLIYLTGLFAFVIFGAGCTDVVDTPETVPAKQVETIPAARTAPVAVPVPEPSVVPAVPTPVAPVVPAVPTPAPEPYVAPTPVAPVAPSVPTNTCCKVCSKGKACGDSCISRSYTCHKPPGCACDAY